MRGVSAVELTGKDKGDVNYVNKEAERREKGQGCVARGFSYLVIGHLLRQIIVVEGSTVEPLTFDTTLSCAVLCALGPLSVLPTPSLSLSLPPPMCG